MSDSNASLRSLRLPYEDAHASAAFRKLVQHRGNKPTIATRQKACFMGFIP
ncbi:hypothetical protein [Calothrix sp. PCC 6303]|uniref:hypothetical protein n=1 Tax=Calothrix sp. PCC 6303 TaxID=1170562 RepID=UPI00130EC689|nr:hypothetical protein [Calothrix sp. PCC 6303]